jgi:carbon monoxide dehydrogenase subunit G
MRTETTLRISMPRKKVYDYLIDPKTWTSWMAGLIAVTDPDNTRWEQPGDTILCRYRLLGRKMETQVVLKENQPAQYTKIHATTSVGGVTQEWFYSDTGETSTILRVVYDTDETTSFFGKIIDRTMIPKTIERDLKTTMGNLEQIFAIGLLD